MHNLKSSYHQAFAGICEGCEVLSLILILPHKRFISEIHGKAVEQENCFIVGKIHQDYTIKWSFIIYGKYCYWFEKYVRSSWPSGLQSMELCGTFGEEASVKAIWEYREVENVSMHNSVYFRMFSCSFSLQTRLLPYPSRPLRHDYYRGSVRRGTMNFSWKGHHGEKVRGSLHTARTHLRIWNRSWPDDWWRHSSCNPPLPPSPVRNILSFESDNGANPKSPELTV